LRASPRRWVKPSRRFDNISAIIELAEPGSPSDVFEVVSIRPAWTDVVNRRLEHVYRWNMGIPRVSVRGMKRNDGFRTVFAVYVHIRPRLSYIMVRL